MKYNILNNERINNRLLTVENNIKNESNSFYDSFLDLFECTLKYILEVEEIDVNIRTAGDLLRNDRVREFLIDKVLENEIDLIRDYIQKCNKHKHQNEKKIEIQTVITYLSAYFNFVNKYNLYKGYEVLSFDVNYFRSLYGQAKRDNKALNKRVQSLIGDLREAYDKNKLSEENMNRMSAILKDNEDALLTIEEQNRVLEEKINALKDIKINSLEIKLDKSLDLLLELKDSIAINKTLSLAVGRTIVGDDFEEWIEDEKRKNK